MKLFIFLLGLPLGLVIMIYRYKIVQFTGKMEWAESHLGAGGTYNLMIIVGLIIWMGCTMYATGSFDLVFGFLKNFF